MVRGVITLLDLPLFQLQGAPRPPQHDVSLYLIVADTYPDALGGPSAALLKRRSGPKTSFRPPPKCRTS